MKVYDKQCSQCLFSKNRIVSKERASEIIKGCVNDQSHFICHKATIEGKDIMCRGYYDKLGHHSQNLRIAQRLNIVQFIKQKQDKL